MKQDLAQTVTEIPAHIQLGIHQQNAKHTWTKGDRVSVFNGTTGNERWRFVGETGNTDGMLSRMNGEPSQTPFGGVVAIYPYNFHNKLTDDGKLCLEIPKTQNYSANPSDMGIMVAFGNNAGLEFHNIMSFVAIRLTGDATIKKIELRGNQGEKLAGRVQIAKDLSVVFADDGCETITLDCGEGIALSDTPTSFCIGLLTSNFDKGLTITICDSEGKVMYHPIAQPINLYFGQTEYLAELQYVGKIPSSCIWYTSFYGNIVHPHDSSKFNANIISNIYEKGKGVILFDKELTDIGSCAFENCTDLISITIPDSVTGISKNAFCDCSSLTSITIPYSITRIDGSAFRGCTMLEGVYITDISAWCNIKFDWFDSNPVCCACNLYLNGELITDLVIPDGITEINNFAFENCRGLTNVTIPDSVTKIGERAFCGCTGLTNIGIPESVKEISKYTFYGCTSLTSIAIPNSVTEIGERVFLKCTRLVGIYGKFALEDNRCLAVDGKLVAFAPAELTEYNIPDSVTEIGEGAFCDCTGLTSVTIPYSVTTIGRSAFSGCTGLISVAIPDSVTKIGGGAFCGCTGITSMTIPDSVTKIDRSAFRGCTSLTSITIPDSVTEIGDCAFFGCTDLTSVTIPDSVTIIGRWVFSGCIRLMGIYGRFALEDNRCLAVDGKLIAFAPAGLTEYTIPDSVATIGRLVFKDCIRLKNVIIPDSVTAIDEKAFLGCTGLRSITIPCRVTEIGWYAFNGCIGLITVYCKPTTPPSLGYDSFSGISSNAKIYVPNASVEAYKSAEGWSKYTSQIEGYDF